MMLVTSGNSIGRKLGNLFKSVLYFTDYAQQGNKREITKADIGDRRMPSSINWNPCSAYGHHHHPIHYDYRTDKLLLLTRDTTTSFLKFRWQMPRCCTGKPT
jgi:hypothetical protein